MNYDAWSFSGIWSDRHKATKALHQDIWMFNTTVQTNHFHTVSPYEIESDWFWGCLICKRIGFPVCKNKYSQRRVTETPKMKGECFCLENVIFYSTNRGKQSTTFPSSLTVWEKRQQSEILSSFNGSEPMNRFVSATDHWRGIWGYLCSTNPCQVHIIF